jgi:purine-binding chemotaxis protein CheW
MEIWMDIRNLRENPELWHILEERARNLAQQEIDTHDGQDEEILVFRLGDGGYSMPARFVQEVQPLTRYTPLPSTPPFIVGLVNVRGKILTALDIRPLLDIAQTNPKSQAFLLIVSANGVQIGILADVVVEVRHGDLNLSPALSTTAGRGVTWVRGVDQDLNLLIDPPVLLADPRIAINGETDSTLS